MPAQSGVTDGSLMGLGGHFGGGCPKMVIFDLFWGGFGGVLSGWLWGGLGVAVGLYGACLLSRWYRPDTIGELPGDHLEGSKIGSKTSILGQKW